MIQFVNVTKAYDSKESDLVAVENVSFEIDDGEFVFLIGPSGSGKTTLIKMLIREEAPSAGKVYFENQDVTVFNRNQIYQLRRKIGVVFQDYKLIEDKTTYENIEFVMEAAGKSEKEIKETVPYLLDIVGLADRSKAFPRELSGGEKQRVAIARALANNPKVLIADEPTGNLDPDAAWEVVQILKKVNDWGTTVIMSTHGSDIVNKISKRVLQMSNGVLVRDEKIGQYVSVTDKSKKNFEEKFVTIENPVEKVEVGDDKPSLTSDEVTEPEVDIEPESKPEEVVIETEEKIEDVGDDKSSLTSDEVTESEVKIEEVGDGKTSPTQTEKPEITLKPEVKIEEVGDDKSSLIQELKPEIKPEVKINLKKEEVGDDKTSPTTENPEEKKDNKKFKISLVHKKGKEKVVEKKPKTEKKDNLPIYTLDMPSKLVDILEANGYSTVEKLVNAGIEDVKKIKELDETDVEIIRKSIVNFIQAE